MRAILILIFMTQLGCQAMIYGRASEFNKLELGMSKARVIEILGTPVSTQANAESGEEQLIFKKMKHTISAWPRTYQVTLKAGRVIKWGEQYEEKNVNNF